MCWGSNRTGQTGLPHRLPRPGDDEERHACEAGASGGTACWPLGEDGQREGRYVAVSAGAAHTCALRESGALDCWGGERSGPTPWNPEEMEGPFVAVGAGRNMTCALRQSGEAVCWQQGRSLGSDPFPVFTLTTGGP